MENNDNMLKNMAFMKDYEEYRRETSCCHYDGNSSDFEHDKNLWSNIAATRSGSASRPAY